MQVFTELSIDGKKVKNFGNTVAVQQLRYSLTVSSTVLYSHLPEHMQSVKFNINAFIT